MSQLKNQSKKLLSGSNPSPGNPTNAKLKIKGVVVVEGRSDTAKLKSLFDVETIETGGNQISQKTINLIQKTAETQEIILFLDPDRTGDWIRGKIAGVLQRPYRQCFIQRTDVKGRKIGVAEAEPAAIFRAFAGCYTYDPGEESLSLSEFDALHLDTRLRRAHLCQKLGIGYANQKQLFKRLNMMGFTFAQLREIVDEDIR